MTESATIHSIGPVTRSSDGFPEVVAELELILEEAKRGEIASFAIMKVRPNGTVSTFFTPTVESHKMVAGCAYLQHDLIVAQERER